MGRSLPAPFKPKLAHGYAVGGICLIRLKQIRPTLVPWAWGLTSENAAHRIAVEWEESGRIREGVFVPRRDTSSRLNSWAGGRVFPGVHHRADFEVMEEAGRYRVEATGRDRKMRVHVTGNIADRLPSSSVFHDVAEVSRFFQAGALGYSRTANSGVFDGMELHCHNWCVDPLDVEEVSSSFFQNEGEFPKGSVNFDCALLMRNIQHEWISRPDLTTHS